MKISISNISKTFNKENKVLDNLSLTINDGEFTTLLGSSGCGKTTLLRIISGLEAPDSGLICFGDKIVFDSSSNINLPPIKRGVAFVFQDFALWPNMTVLKNVEFSIEASIDYKYKKQEEKNPFKFYLNKRQEIKRLALEALKMVQMEEYSNRLPSMLSGGQKQRVAIARAIAIKPDIILFDEPLSALDAILREQMRIEIKELVAKLNINAIFVTHDQNEAMAISDKIIIMNSGKIVEAGTPTQIYWNPKKHFTAGFIGKATFITPNTILRPEHIYFTKQTDSDIEETIEISSVENMGGYFNITGKKDDIYYHLKANQEYELLDKLKIYYNKENIIAINEL